MTTTSVNYTNSLSFAQNLDQIDPLKKFREQFYFPRMNGHNVVYFAGNALGLQPQTTQDYVLNELEDWATYGVEGHLHARNPWGSYHEQFTTPLSKIAGALPEEVVVMNGLSVNLHLLLVSFYRPTKERFKILCESNTFPSDLYAIASQVRFHGLNPEEAIVEIAPRAGEHHLRQEDILNAIHEHKNSLALVLLGGVNYLTGQVFDIKEITAAAHKAGAFAGFDLAHAIGNIKLQLHDWKVDFACWCSYKYLNSGPGGIAGAFIHEDHLSNLTIPRFEGFRGTDKATRFKMPKTFQPTATAESWQLSNIPVILFAAHKAALNLFDEAGMDALIDKSKKLTGYLAFVIEELNEITPDKLEIITPKENCGCQLSIVTHNRTVDFFNKLKNKGILCDWKEPDIIRCAPVPFYNSFEDVFEFGQAVKELL